MELDATRFDKLVQAVIQPAGYRENASPDGKLGGEDAAAIIGIARLIVAADEREDAEEMGMFDSLVEHLCTTTDIDEPDPLNDMGDEEERDEALASYASRLRGKPAGDLAYVVAYLISVADLDLAREEQDLVDEIREALGIDENRANELGALAGELVTPEA